jgi:peptidoglycan/LPS O-acetylase OafA/YrhL
MRGIAALLVVIYHYSISNGTPVVKNAYIAVDFFFALSGFVISYSYKAKLESGMQFHDFVARRVGRLLPMMAIGMLIGAPALYVYGLRGLSEFRGKEIALSVLSNLSFLPYLNEKRWTISVLHSSGIIFPTDPPLWSIFYEMIASICFVFLIKLRQRNLLRTWALALSLVVLSAVLRAVGSSSLVKVFDDAGWATQYLLSGFPRVLFSFVSGMLIFDWYSRGASSVPIALSTLPQKLGVGSLYLLLIFALSFPFELWGAYYIFSIVFFAPFLILLAAHAQTATRLGARLSSFLGWLSYPIYCLHRPVLLMMQDLADQIKTSVFSAVGVLPLAFALTVVLSAICAYVVDRYIQPRLTNLLRSSLKKLATPNL